MTNRHKFKLFLVGAETEENNTIIQLVRKALDSAGEKNYKLEIIDIFKDPDAASENDIFATPSLIREDSNPVKRITGSFRNKKRVLEVLGLHVFN